MDGKGFFCWTDAPDRFFCWMHGSERSKGEGVGRVGRVVAVIAGGTRKLQEVLISGEGGG